jgi:transposase InsO family protein
VTDVTEFNVHGQKLYLSACMDLYNGEIIAHRMARRPVFDLVSDCRRQFKIDHLCQLNFDQGSNAGCVAPGCG